MPTPQSSFAPAVAAPVQSQTNRRAASNGAQVVGGGAQGDAITIGPQTAPGPVGSQLGQYFGELMQPYIEAKQKSLFYKGFSEAAHGAAIEDLTSSNSPITRIFGPSGFEQGAQYYTSQAALDKFGADMVADIPNLARMTPEDSAKVIQQKSDDMMTKDEGTNQLIQGGLMERMGPVMKQVATARIEWQQNNAINSQSLAHVEAATFYQGVASYSATHDPDSPVTAMANGVAQHNFLSGRAKPEGMTDESYKKYLGDSAMADIVAGRFYAVKAMKDAGAWDHLDPDTRTKLEIANERYANLANGKNAALVAPQLLALETQTKLGTVPGGAMGAMKTLADINSQVKRMSGTDVDLFDYKDFVGGGGKVIDVLVAAQRRAEARAEQVADMQTRRGWDLEDRAAAEARDDAKEAAKTAREAKGTAQTLTMWGMGDVNAAKAAGMTDKDFEPIALTEVRSGNYSGILRAYQSPGGSWVSSSVSNQLQSTVKSAIGDEYTPEIGKAHEQWAAMYHQSPAFAAAYYGDMHAPMVRFDNLLRSQTPQAAFAQAFGNPAIYHAAAIPAERAKTASLAINSVIGKQESYWFNPWGVAKLSPSSLATTTALMTNQFAILSAGDSNLTDVELAQQSFASLTKDGSYERYGAYAFGGKPGPTLAQLTGLQGKEMADTFTAVVARSFRSVGFKEDPAAVSTTITRFKMPNGTPAFHVEAYNSDGSGHRGVTITVPDLKSYHEFLMTGAQMFSGTLKDPAKVKAFQDYSKKYYPEKPVPTPDMTAAVMSGYRN